VPAYWIARARIIDPIAFKKYTDRSPTIIAKYGGRFLARGGRFEIMEGPNKFHRFVVIEFPTFERGVACFQSPEYREAAAFRRSGAGEVELVTVDGAMRRPRSALIPMCILPPQGGAGCRRVRKISSIASRPRM
jgi:uncharacterized protein (DUF1330 family)